MISSSEPLTVKSPGYLYTCDVKSVTRWRTVSEKEKPEVRKEAKKEEKAKKPPKCR